MEEQLDIKFRGAMRALASAVTVVSSVIDEQWFGMTATAVTSLSMHPASLLVCVNRAASLHSVLLQTRQFCVNILHGNQEHIAKVFGSRPVERRFAHGGWRAETDQIPYLEDAQANILCDLDGERAYGSHTIIIGSLSHKCARTGASSAVSKRWLHSGTRNWRRLDNPHSWLRMKKL
jgi:flavin reductase